MLATSFLVSHVRCTTHTEFSSLLYSALFRCFQSNNANERSFTHALAGVEMEDVRPNTAQIEPRLQLPW